MTETPLRRFEHEMAGVFGRHRYHGSQHRPEGDTMSLVETIEADISKGVTDGMEKVAEAYEHFRTLAESELPKLSGLAKTAAGNPLVDAALSAVHLSPALLTSLADMISKADSDIAAAGTAPAAPAETPADPAQAADPAPAPQPS